MIVNSISMRSGRHHDGVLRGWNSHFKRLYSFEKNPKFDPFHEELVENLVTKYLKTPDVDHDYT
ncbi:hypothetical protein DPMN_049487 [Dreissena polymorpha]|uniref:Uncharacterized protein n=1 Tax=Dreissena polymorpha TaxID=45954 RepID=A0A9D4CEF8_DREPO|nr:hypothetical protein DPMN_049487 [Dreissena polymorpha]